MHWVKTVRLKQVYNLSALFGEKASYVNQCRSKNLSKYLTENNQKSSK